MSGKAPNTVTESTVAGDLERLVTAERQLNELLASARDDARRTVAQAQESTQAREQQAAEELDRAATALRSEIEAARDRAIAALREQAALDVARFEGAGAETIQRLVEYVLDRVAGVEPES